VNKLELVLSKGSPLPLRAVLFCWASADNDLLTAETDVCFDPQDSKVPGKLLVGKDMQKPYTPSCSY
jgi:hypothetical protein